MDAAHAVDQMHFVSRRCQLLVFLLLGTWHPVRLFDLEGHLQNTGRLYSLQLWVTLNFVLVTSSNGLGTSRGIYAFGIKPIAVLFDCVAFTPTAFPGFDVKLCKKQLPEILRNILCSTVQTRATLLSVDRRIVFTALFPRFRIAVLLVRNPGI